MASQQLLHLALILDGNRRFARRRGLPRFIGHRRGIENFKKLLSVFSRFEVGTVTAYALSTENIHSRGVLELRNLFREIERFAADFETFAANEIRVRIFGELKNFPTSTKRVLQKLVRTTADFRKLNLNLCLGYGGRAEIVRAARKLVKAGRPISEKSFAAALDSAGQSDPDLLIRTGGSSRLSNFLPWQLAYTELYFTEKLWPEFNEAELAKAIKWFREQQRNFGK